MQLKQNQEGGQFLITISNKQNEVVKFINEKHQIKCQKIINLDIQKHRQLIPLYRVQLGRIKDYLQRRHQLKSHLFINNHMEITEKVNKNNLIFKINTQYCQYPTLEDFLKKENIQPQPQQMKRDGKTLIFFIQEFLQIILRAGGIDYFFYTIRNIFIISSKTNEYDIKYNKLILNYTSMVGTKLFVDNKGIYRDDLWQIFPLLPPNFYSLKREGPTLQLNNIVKKRALGYLIICFIVKRIPNTIDVSKLQVLVKQEQIQSLLRLSVQMFQKIIKLFNKLFKEAQKETKIDFIKLIQDIFIAPYTQENINDKNYQFITWDTICNCLHPIKQPQIIIPSQKYFEKMILNIWKSEKHQSYFTARQFGLQTVANKGELVINNSKIYFLTKFNCNFHRILKHVNPCMLIMSQHFSEDVNQIIVKLVKLLNQEEPAKEENSQVQSDIENMLVKKGESLTTNEFNRHLFNPFTIKNGNQRQQIKQQIKGDSDVIKGSPEFISSAYSFQYFDKQSSKMLISVSHKQAMMSQFCDALWKF